MSNTSRDFWQQAQTASADLLLLLERACKAPIPVSTNIHPPIPLELSTSDLHLADEILALGIDTVKAQQLQASFTAYILETASRFERAYERDWQEAIGLEVASDENRRCAFTAALVRLYRDSFATSVERSREAILRIASSVGSRESQEESSGSFSDAASELLLAAYERNQRPSVGDRKHLAAACGLSVPQVNQWFTNRRSRAKKYERLGKPLSSMRKGRVVARKVSSGSSTSTSSASPGSDTSVDLRSDNGGEWQHATPARSTSWTASSPSDSILADQYLAATPSPPILQQPIYSSYTPNNLLNEQQPFFSAPLPASLNIQPPPFTQDPSASLVQPDTSTQYFQQMQLPLPTLSDLDNSLLSNIDIDAGIGDDFWKNIMQAAGLTDQQQESLDPVDQLKGITIPPSLMDWSHVFGDMSGFTMPEQQQ